jgi:type II secretory pathway pseudopilin PulG
LLEVLVMAIIISVLAVASSTALFNGLGFLKEAEDTSRASSLAYSMMEYSLSRGYENLADVGPLTYTWPDNLTTEYFIHVRTGKQPSNFKREIPFKEVNVTASYWRNQTFRYKTKRSIFLSNKVPYPTIHTLHYKYVAPTVTAHKIPQDASVREINEENAERMVNDRYKFMPFNDAGDKYLPVDINFEVPKDITFQICVSIRPGPNTKMADVDSASTMRMQPMFDDEIFGLTGLGGGWSPLKSQQVQCQVVTRKNVKAGPHKLSVKWIQDEVRSAGNEVDFYLRQVEVSVMATESLMGAEPPEGKPHGE